MPLRQILAQMISRLQINKPFVLVLVTEHTQHSEINAAVIRKLCVKKYLASAEQQKQVSSSAIFKTCPRPILARLHSGAQCLAYVTFLVLRYAYVYAFAYAYVAV